MGKFQGKYKKNPWNFLTIFPSVCVVYILTSDYNVLVMYHKTGHVQGKAKTLILYFEVYFVLNCDIKILTKANSITVVFVNENVS